jgi:hypothetical protein
MNTSAGLATNFGNQAAALQLAKAAKASQATQTGNQKLASIKNAKDKGLTDDASAAAQAEQVLSAMSPDANSTEAPHQNPAVNSAIEMAKGVPGSVVEASTSEGSVKVTMGDAAIQLATLNQPIRQHCAFWDPNGAPLTESWGVGSVRETPFSRYRWGGEGAPSPVAGSLRRRPGELANAPQRLFDPSPCSSANLPIQLALFRSVRQIFSLFSRVVAVRLFTSRLASNPKFVLSGSIFS